MTEAIALKSMPFDSNEIYNEETGETTFDRVAFSKDLADWMLNYFSNGILVKGSKVIADELQVTHTGGLNLSVNKGEVIINGRTGWVESATELTVDIGGSADRIDRVVMELNVADRYIYLKLLKGTEAETPEAPALTQTEDVFQIPLAQARVNAETAVVASVTDERPDYISNVTIGIEPPTANSAVAISVSDEVKNILGADNVDDGLKIIPDIIKYPVVDNSLFEKYVYEEIPAYSNNESYSLTTGDYNVWHTLAEYDVSIDINDIFPTIGIKAVVKCYARISYNYAIGRIAFIDSKGTIIGYSQEFSFNNINSSGADVTSYSTLYNFKKGESITSMKIEVKRTHANDVSFSNNIFSVSLYMPKSFSLKGGLV